MCLEDSRSLPEDINATEFYSDQSDDLPELMSDSPPRLHPYRFKILFLSLNAFQFP